jgi:hypothetical protein
MNLRYKSNYRKHCIRLAWYDATIRMPTHRKGR